MAGELSVKTPHSVETTARFARVRGVNYFAGALVEGGVESLAGLSHPTNASEIASTNSANSFIVLFRIVVVSCLIPLWQVALRGLIRQSPPPCQALI